MFSSEFLQLGDISISNECTRVGSVNGLSFTLAAIASALGSKAGVALRFRRWRRFAALTGGGGRLGGGGFATLPAVGGGSLRSRLGGRFGGGGFAALSGRGGRLAALTAAVAGSAVVGSPALGAG